MTKQASSKELCGEGFYTATKPCIREKGHVGPHRAEAQPSPRAENLRKALHDALDWVHQGEHEEFIWNRLQQALAQPSSRAGEPPTWEQIKSLEISKEMVQRAARGTGVEIGWRLELFTANLNTMLYDAIHALAAATAERTPPWDAIQALVEQMECYNDGDLPYERGTDLCVPTNKCAKCDLRRLLADRQPPAQRTPPQFVDHLGSLDILEQFCDDPKCWCQPPAERIEGAHSQEWLDGYAKGLSESAAPKLDATPEVNSRSQQKRIATLKGEPMPTFKPDASQVKE